MKRSPTSIDMQRITFVESLYDSLKKQASDMVADQKKFIILASSYITDGLEDDECVELLMIDGLSRESAESYVAMATDYNADKSEGLNEYSFRFEDSDGKIWSSYDIGEIVKASSEDDAWIKAETTLSQNHSLDFGKVTSISRI